MFQMKGFSLIESLFALSFSLLIVLFSLECFSSAQKHFFRLKKSEESNMGAYAALDRMRGDLLDAGSGLVVPMQQGFLQGTARNGEALVILSKEESLIATADLEAGQSRITLETFKDVKEGREICLFDNDKGECHTVSQADQNSVVLESCLGFSYKLEEVDIVLLRRTSLFFDEENRVLRRKVNASPAQPLLEETASFNFDLTSWPNVVKISLKLEDSKEQKHEIFVFTKNTAMAPHR